MKTLIVILGALAVMTVVYAFNAENLRKFNQDLIQCNEQLGGPLSERRIEKVICSFKKDGKILNSNGEIVKEEMLKVFDDTISDPIKLEQAHEKFNKCRNEVIQSGSTGSEQTTKIVSCSVGILELLDRVN